MKNKFLDIMMHYRSKGHQSYVLLCSKTTCFPPSEWEFWEKFGTFSKVKIFQNPSYYILEKMNENYDALKIYGAPLALSVLDLYALFKVRWSFL